jgi:hypothetical protein
VTVRRGSRRLIRSSCQQTFVAAQPRGIPNDRSPKTRRSGKLRCIGCGSTKYQTARALRSSFRRLVEKRKCFMWKPLGSSAIYMRLYGSLALLVCSAAAHQPVISIAISVQIRATRFVAIVPRLSFRLGDRYVLCPRVSLSAPPRSVQYLANRPGWLPK